MSIWSSMLAIITYVFPENYEKRVALTETCYGIGTMIGPVVGSFLKTLGGFHVPFISGGTTMVLITMAMWFIVPHVDSEDNKDMNSNDVRVVGYMDILKVSGSDQMM